MTVPAVPIRRMLNSMALTTTGFALLVAVVLFLAGEFLALRRASLQEMRVLSEAIASNSTAALAFDVPDDARGVLNAFRSHPHIQAAALYDNEGQMFANFPTGVSPASLPATAPELGFRFDGWTLVGTSVVTEGQGPMGRLFVRSDMRPVYGRLAMHGLLASLVIGLALLVAWLITRRLQRKLSTPLLEMAETAKRVSERRDYTVRARAAGIDELDALTNAFNHMLTQNARVESRLTAQVNRLALLQQITHSIGSRHDLNSIFQVVLRSLEDHLPIHFGCICLRDSANESVVVESTGSATAQLAGLLGLSAGTAVPVGHNGLYRCINGALIHEPDTSEVGSPFTMRFADASLYSLVLAPLVVESNVFGVLVAARRERQSFSSADCEFLKQLSEHVALASHQAQLYGALQTTYEDLRHSQQTVMQNERLRALGEMASGIAHDINNAISPASLYAEMLLNTEANLSNASRGRLDTIRRAIEDVAGTIERMREFYRPREAARSFARLDIHGAIGQVLQLTEPRWRAVPQERGVVIELRKELAQSLPEVMGDEIELRDALTNLIFNAVDAMPDGGTLTVRTRPAAGGNGHSWVYVEVSDTGVGMDDETRRRCIEPFYTTKGQRGTGLGLASVYGMLQRHNATLEIDSAPGQGTTMRMIFPVLSQDTATTGSHAISAGTLRKHRILIIDDDPVLTRSLRDALESEGHAVESASGGQAGIDAFIAAQGSRREFALVITDLGMPRIDGRKVAAAIKQASPTVPVVMLTGWGQRLLDEHDIPPNVDRVLSKPPRLAQLRSTIFELVG